MLAASPGLLSLNLNDTGLCDDGVQQLAAALASGGAPALSCLELALNEVTAAGAEALSGALAGRTALTRCVSTSVIAPVTKALCLAGEPHHLHHHGTQ